MIHQFKIYMMTINNGVVEKFINCADDFSALMIASEIYVGRVIDIEMIF